MQLKADLHIHSALSGCGSLEMAPRQIVLQAKKCGLDLIAIADHNQMENSLRIADFARRQGIGFFYGMEAQTIEEVHLVCLFEEKKYAERFFEQVYDYLPSVKNNPEIFGDQPVVDEKDEIVCFEEKLLANSLQIGMTELKELVRRFNGIIFPSHIESYPFGLLTMLGFIPEDFQNGYAEIYYQTDRDELLKNFPRNDELRQLKLIKNSDAHYLKDIGRGFSIIEVNALALNAIDNALRNGNYFVYPDKRNVDG